MGPSRRSIEQAITEVTNVAFTPARLAIDAVHCVHNTMLAVQELPHKLDEVIASVDEFKAELRSDMSDLRGDMHELPEAFVETARDEIRQALPAPLGRRILRQQTSPRFLPPGEQPKAA